MQAKIDNKLNTPLFLNIHINSKITFELLISIGNVY